MKFSTLATFASMALVAVAMPMGDQPSGDNKAGAQAAYESMQSATDMMRAMKDSSNNNSPNGQNGLNLNQEPSSDNKPTHTENKVKDLTPSASMAPSKSAPSAASSSSATPTPTHKVEDNPLAGLPIVGGLLSGTGLI